MDNCDHYHHYNCDHYDHYDHVFSCLFIMVAIQHDELCRHKYENVSITGVTWNVWFSTRQDGSVKLWDLRVGVRSARTLLLLICSFGLWNFRG